VRSFTVLIERCPETRHYVGSILVFPGPHSQGESMREVIAMLLENGKPTLELEFVGILSVLVG
jgi:predicted RNase H-like HicB family nuclease